MSAPVRPGPSCSFLRKAHSVSSAEVCRSQVRGGCAPRCFRRLAGWLRCERWVGCGARTPQRQPQSADAPAQTPCAKVCRKCAEVQLPTRVLRVARAAGVVVSGSGVPQAIDELSVRGSVGRRQRQLPVDRALCLAAPPLEVYARLVFTRRWIRACDGEIVLQPQECRDPKVVVHRDQPIVTHRTRKEVWRKAQRP